MWLYLFVLSFSKYSVGLKFFRIATVSLLLDDVSE